MTEEPNQPSNTESAKSEKLLIDDTTNFQFHAAYMVYDETFDKASSASDKAELNGNILDLKENKISLETFYQNIAPIRKIGPMPRQERFVMQTQRKKDWRMKTQRQERIKRHKK
jgi:hypothetical protein